MITFKKKEIIYRPYEIVLRTAVNVVMIICVTYLIMVTFFQNTTVSGHSMNNTLKANDKVLINSMAYSFHAPQRYDIIVFKDKKSGSSNYYVKRIVGLPGETVQIKNGSIYIDGKKLESTIFSTEIYNAGIVAEPLKLEYNEYFVLGDNVNNSDDSRFSNIGIVNSDLIVGKLWLVVKPLKKFGFIKYKQ